MADGDTGAQFLSDGVVRWLFGEGFLAKATERPATYRLTDRGRSALGEALVEEEVLLGDVPAAVLPAGVPLLLLSPAPHSEELDYLLVVTLGQEEIDRHWWRVERFEELRSAQRFEFVQFRDEVFALPISPRLMDLELLPTGNARLLPNGLEDAEEFGARYCPDRGVNYGPDWMQWFGGFDPESPLIVSERLRAEEFEALARSS